MSITTKVIVAICIALVAALIFLMFKGLGGPPVVVPRSAL
jgi:Cu/Ag efflux pump CusA